MNENDKREALAKVCEEIIDLLIRKSRDYGSENIRLTGGELGLTVRVIDKAMRLHNLNLRHAIEGEPPPEAENETVEDSWRDLVGYGLIALVKRKGVEW